MHNYTFKSILLQKYRGYHIIKLIIIQNLQLIR